MEWIPVIVFAALIVWVGYSALNNADMPLDEEEVRKSEGKDRAAD